MLLKRKLKIGDRSEEAGFEVSLCRERGMNRKRKPSKYENAFFVCSFFVFKTNLSQSQSCDLQVLYLFFLFNN